MEPDVVVQIYPWFKFYFLLFQSHYHTLPYPKTKLNHNTDIQSNIQLSINISLKKRRRALEAFRKDLTTGSVD